MLARYSSNSAAIKTVRLLLKGNGIYMPSDFTKTGLIKTLTHKQLPNSALASRDRRALGPSSYVSYASQLKTFFISGSVELGNYRRSCHSELQESHTYIHYSVLLNFTPYKGLSATVRSWQNLYKACSNGYNIYLHNFQITVSQI